MRPGRHTRRPSKSDHNERPKERRERHPPVLPEPASAHSHQPEPIIPTHYPSAERCLHRRPKDGSNNRPSSDQLPTKTTKYPCHSQFTGPCFNRGPIKQSKTKRSQAINNERPKGLPTTTHQLSRNQHQRPHTSPSQPTTTPLHGTSIMPSTSARDQGGEQRASPAVKTCPPSLPSTLPQSDIQCHAPLIGRKVTSIISYL